MTNTRPLGLAIAGIGAVVVIVGTIGWVSSGGEPDDTASATTTATSLETATTAAPTTTGPPDTTVAPTTTIPTTTTTTVPPTTTTTLGRDDIVAFVERFSAAIEANDESFVADRLHPEVVDGFGADLCATWITDEIMTLSDYRLIEGLNGPLDQVVATPDGERSIIDTWTGRVMFTFQGQEFEGDAGFAILDGVVYWLGQCR